MSPDVLISVGCPPCISSPVMRGIIPEAMVLNMREMNKGKKTEYNIIVLRSIHR